MNVNITIDWRFVAALGVVTVGTIFAIKMDKAAVERVSVRAVDATNGHKIADKMQ